jgi:hypothetical protein
MYRISFDGSIIDERAFAVIGGKSEAVQALLKEKGFTQPPDLQGCPRTLYRRTRPNWEPEALTGEFGSGGSRPHSRRTKIPSVSAG